MKFGVFVPQGWKMDLTEIADPVEQYEAMTAVAKAVDANPAYDSIWLYDHFHTVPTPRRLTTFECWTATATLARDTTRVHLGQMVGCNGYRNPALYAKIASTVDVAAQGRLYAGIGAGWYEHEWRAYGYAWTDTPTRMRRFREAVGIIHAMWTEDSPEFKGEHYAIERPINEPKSARPGRKIPLWIGGGGEQVTLRLVAQYGDACNVVGDSATIRHKLDVLRGHCEKVGRDYDQITKSTQIRIHLIEPGDDPEKASAPYRGDHYTWERYQSEMLVGTIDQVRSEVERLMADGIDYLILYIAKAAYEPELVQYVSDEVVKKYG
jgi:F420-dependent oxidoreductase-like protein